MLAFPIFMEVPSSDYDISIDIYQTFYVISYCILYKYFSLVWKQRRDLYKTFYVIFTLFPEVSSANYFTSTKNIKQTLYSISSCVHYKSYKLVQKQRRSYIRNFMFAFLLVMKVPSEDYYLSTKVI